MNEQNIPIDIHSSKLLDWLISRRHCSNEWQSNAAQIRHRIQQAMQDMPEHPKVRQLLAEDSLNYFNCKQIVEILKDTEADSKNIFGFYSSQRIKDWQEILALYERDGVYLAESAQFLQRLVQFEVPAVKKQIARAYATSEECIRKQADYAKSAKEAEKTYDQECAKLNVATSARNVRNELLKLANDLPEYLEQVAEKSVALKDACSHYVNFRRYLLSANDSDVNCVDDASVLPILRFVQTHGNVTRFEWLHGKKPTQIIEMSRLTPEFDGNDVDAEDDQIDFGDDEIDFGDFEITDVGEASNGIELETVNGDTLLVSHSPSRPHDAGGSSEELIARDEDALSMLEHADTQRRFIDDVVELSAFLRGRVRELTAAEGGTAAADLLLANQLVTSDSASSRSLAIENPKTLTGWLTTAITCHEMLCDQNKRHLMKIRSSKTYVDTMAEQLASKKALIGKFERLATLMDEKQIESLREAEMLKPQLEQLASRTRQLQKQIESEISVRYKNRPVNIMGGITAALAAT